MKKLLGIVVLGLVLTFLLGIEIFDFLKPFISLDLNLSPAEDMLHINKPRTTIPKSFFINLNNSLTQKYNQYVWMLMARYRQVVQSRKMLLALGLYKQYLYYVAPIARLQGRLRIFCH